MAAKRVHQFANSITCHAWSPDHSMIAFCPNNSEVHIYKSVQDKWDKLYVLQKHDQIVSAIDWSTRSNKIVTVSHDRNSYVWNLEGSEWVPTLVILRLNRAALCVQWSPRENKFAVGSGAKTVCICYYEQENNWWVSKLIRKRHESSVTSVAWHPNNVLIATTSTDGKCRVFSTFIKGVDTRDPSAGSATDSKFGEQIIQLDLSFSWAFGVKWSPSGNTLAYVGHNSMIYFVDDVGPAPSAQTVAFRDLPLRDVLFVSEKMVIGVGFDCNPMIFAADEGGMWNFVRFLGEKKSTSSTAEYGRQLPSVYNYAKNSQKQAFLISKVTAMEKLRRLKSSNAKIFLTSVSLRSYTRLSGAFGRLYGQSKHGSSNDIDPSKAKEHDNLINCIVPLIKGEPTHAQFSTSGLDGKVIVWDLESQDDLSEYM